MTKTQQPIWLAKACNPHLHLEPRFFSSEAQAQAYGNKLNKLGHKVKISEIPLLDTYKAFRKFMADAA